MDEQGLMSYVIHTRLGEIVVTDVAGRQGDYNSVKGRVTTLKCNFHLPQDDVNKERLKKSERVLRPRHLKELMQDELTDNWGENLNPSKRKPTKKSILAHCQIRQNLLYLSYLLSFQQPTISCEQGPYHVL